MSRPKYLVLLLLLLQVCLLQAQSKPNCKEIQAVVEVSRPQGSSKSILKISFNEKGDFKVKLLDAKGNITQLKSLEVSDLPKGEYDLIITDSGSTPDRCPYYKRIKIEG